jgi:hypothetical protein
MRFIGQAIDLQNTMNALTVQEIKLLQSLLIGLIKNIWLLTEWLEQKLKEARAVQENCQLRKQRSDCSGKCADCCS